MSGNYWYWQFYVRNWLNDLKRQRRTYGLRSFAPHRHVPARIPAGDGGSCCRCGTRKAIVKERFRNG